MSKHKTAKNVAINSWLSAKPDCKEGRFIQVGNSLLLSSVFTDLSVGARYLYMCMADEAGASRDFKFTKTTLKKYHLPERTTRRYINELVEKGFITRDSGWNVRQANRYSFSFAWKQRGSQTPS